MLGIDPAGIPEQFQIKTDQIKVSILDSIDRIHSEEFPVAIDRSNVGRRALQRKRTNLFEPMDSSDQADGNSLELRLRTQGTSGSSHNVGGAK